MSLINKMLRDLESRQQDNVAAAPTRPVYQDLRSPRSRRAGARAPLVVGLVAIAGVVYGGYYAWDKWGRTDVPSPRSLAEGPAVAPPVARAPATPVTPAVADTNAVLSPTNDGAAPSPVPAPVPVQPEPIPAAPPVVVKANPELIEAPAAVVPAEKKTQAPVTILAPTRTAKGPAAKPKPTAAVATEEVRVEGSVDKRVRPFTSEEKAESAYRTALRYLDQGRADDAAHDLIEALHADPQHKRARELLVGLSLKNGRWQKAQQLLEEGLVHAPKHYPFAQLLARIHIDHGAEQKALALLERTAPLASNDPDFRSLLATVYQRVGRHADAVTTFGQVVELRPGDARAWLGLAISLESERQSGPARRAYERAQQLGGLPTPLAKYTEQRLVALRSAQ